MLCFNGYQYYGMQLTGFYRSINGGSTWTATVLPQPAGYAGAEAPTIDYAFPNTFIVTVHLFNGINDGTIASYTSFDDGLALAATGYRPSGVRYYCSNDEPFIAVDRSPGSPYRGHAYVGYTPLATASSAIFTQKRSLTRGDNLGAT